MFEIIGQRRLNGFWLRFDPHADKSPFLFLFFLLMLYFFFFTYNKKAA